MCVSSAGADWLIAACHSNVDDTLTDFWSELTVIVQEGCENRGGRPNEPSGFRGRKTILNHASALVSSCP